MTPLFPYNNTKAAYNFFYNYFHNNYGIEKIKRKVCNDYLDFSFKFNILEPVFSIINFNKGFNELYLFFMPYAKYRDFTSYSLCGNDINIVNLNLLMKISRYYNIPKCKICGKHPIKYYEESIYKQTYSADITGNPFLFKYDIDYSPLHVRLKAECSCGNKWTLKNIISASQIKDLAKLGENYSNFVNRSEISFKKEIDSLFMPTEYAKVENEKNILNGLA